MECQYPMPRAGGEAEKLGARFEGVWTADCLLDLLSGDALTLTLEPFGPDSLGIEFIKETATGQCEFHSVKRQTTGATWTLYELTAPGSSGRSILGDLLAKLSTHADSKVVFVSATTANELNEICERAVRSDVGKTFTARLDESAALKRKFDTYILPICGHDVDKALAYVKRIQTVGITEAELIRRVEQRIRYVLYRPDGEEVNPVDVRLLLGEFVYGRLGQTTRIADVAAFVDQNGYRQRDWGRDATVRERVAARNRVYARQVESDLIQGVVIERSESTKAFEALKSGEKRRVVVVGPAGLGKSCAFAQVLRLLESDRVPVLALRMDVQAQVLTAHNLGRAMDFPMSPALVLAGIANGERCVLAIDQLDALSYASGRNPQLWTVFEELISECERFSQMRVLLACRAFDAEHDARLRRLITDELSTVRIDLDLLRPELVREIVCRAGIDGKVLKEKEVELLRTPLHLNLYLQSDPTAHPSSFGVQELFARYWEHKHKLVELRLGRETKWADVIRRLTRWLSENQTLSAPKDILDDFHGDIEAMASEHVLVLDGKTCRFSHEAFFDYAFARTFVAGGGHVLDLLLTPNECQHLFRRAQVRQILSYQRGRDPAAYHEEMRAVLTEPRVRFHIKRLVLDWVRSLDDPTRDEWELLQSVVSDSKIGHLVRLVPYYSVAWFDLLNAIGTWARWLASEDVPTVNHAIWLLSLPPVMKARSAQVAALVSPHLDNGEIWKKRFLALINFGEIYHSREMFDLFLQALRAGWLDDAKDQLFWHRFHAMPKDCPKLAAELLGEYFDRICTIRPTGSPFEDIGHRQALPENFIHDLEKSDPESFVRQLLPRVVREVQARKMDSPRGCEDRDHLWPYLYLHEEYDFKSAFLPSLGRALAALATENPDIFDEVTQELDSIQSHTLAFLLLKGWSANPSRYADRAARYLVTDRRRLDIGYAAWSGRGEGTLAVSRGVIRVIAPYCSERAYVELEASILSFKDNREQKRPRSIGFKEFLLLDGLPRLRMSVRAVARFEQLERKFRGADLSSPKPIGVQFVGSPISATAAKKMSDTQWVSAMGKYATDRTRSFEEFERGGVHELASVLEHETQNDKSRFADLALKMGDDIAAAYFDAILRGIVKLEVDKAHPEQFGPRANEPLDTAAIVKVIRRAHRLPGHPCGRWICWTIHRSAEREFPDDVFEILTHYALNDPDPEKELWQTPASGATPYYGGDPIMAGINSVRGAAADAIAKLLFADRSRWAKLEAAVNGLVKDKSLAVRACTVECLTALLNLDRERAVELFLLLCKDAEVILGCHTVDVFLHYAFYSHYEQLRPLTLEMLKSKLEGPRETAARQVTVAAFGQPLAQVDLETALAGDEKCRVATANVFATNLPHPLTRESCRRHLKQLFNDESAKVRDTASWCFRNLSDAQLAEERDLIFAFVQSPAFLDGCDDLLFKLKESKEQLPDVVIAAAERAIMLHKGCKEGLATRATYYLPELIFRLYDQSPDSNAKIRCLDIIDQMLEMGFSTVESELAKMER